MEAGVDVDPNLKVTDPSVLFDFYVNTCPSQGSRTIRTEVGLMALGVPSSAGWWPVPVTHMAQVCPDWPGSAAGSTADLPVCTETTP